MKHPHLLPSVIALAASLAAAGSPSAQTAGGYGANPTLPAPDLKHDVGNFSKVVGWPKDGMPTVPKGFKVTRFAGDLQSPRNLVVLPNGDVVVAEATTVVTPEKAKDEKTAGQMQSGSAAMSSANRLTLLRDADGDGVAEERHVLLSGLNQPFGLAYVDGHLFVANTDSLMKYPYKLGATAIDDKGTSIMTLPAGGYNNHWTRNLLPAADGRSLYVSVGSASNVGEYGLDTEKGRAAIHQVGLDGSGQKLFATGLRNPVGMSINPVTGALWTAVNERDMIGDDLVPDYLTSVRDGAFYGWPYSYWGRNADPRLKGEGKDLVAKALTPDYAVGAHTASLGLHFYTGQALGPDYQGGAFVAQRGSWNRKPFSGYKVIFIPFSDGKPSGPPQDFVTGFMRDSQSGEVFGRPVGVFQDGKGALLVTDDAGNAIWRIHADRS